MVEVFGTQTSLEMVIDNSSFAKASKNIKDSFERAFKNFKVGMQVGGTQAKGMGAVAQAGAKVGELRDRALGGLGGAGGTAGGKAAAGGITKLLGQVIKMLGPIAIVAAILGSILDFIMPIFKLLGLVLLMFMIPVFKLLKPFLRQAPEFFGGIIKFLGDILKGIMEFVTKFLQDPAGAIGELVDNIIKFLASVNWGEVVSTIINFFVLAIKSMPIVMIATAIINFLSKVNWGEIIIGIVNFIKGLITFGVQVIDAIITFLLGLDWGKIVTDITDFIGGFFSDGGSVIEDIFKALPDPLKTAWNLVVGAIDTARNLLFGENGEGGVWDTLTKAIASARDIIFGPDGKGGLWKTLTKAIESARDVLFGPNGEGGVWKSLTDSVKTAGDALSTVLTNIANILNAIPFLGAGSGGGGGGQYAPGLSPLDAMIRAAQGIVLGSGTTVAEEEAQASLIDRGDFIWRSGQGSVGISSDDDLIGMKDFGKLGGGKTENNYYISGFNDKESIKRIFKEIDEGRRINNQGRLSYVTNIRA